MKKGFTLIELLVSIGIIAVLSAGIISVIGPGSARYSRDTKRQTDLETVVTALAMYRNDLGRYPNCAAGAASCAISTLGTALSTTYLQTYPTDPGAGSGRIYRYRPYATNASGTPIDCNNTTVRCTKFNICAGSEKDTTTNNDASCGSATCGSASQHCVFVKANP